MSALQQCSCQHLGINLFVRNAIGISKRFYSFADGNLEKKCFHTPPRHPLQLPSNLPVSIEDITSLHHTSHPPSHRGMKSKRTRLGNSAVKTKPSAKPALDTDKQKVLPPTKKAATAKRVHFDDDNDTQISKKNPNNSPDTRAGDDEESDIQSEDMSDPEDNENEDESQDEQDQEKSQKDYIHVNDDGDNDDDDDDDETMMETFAISKIGSHTIVEARNDEAALERKLVEIALFTGPTGNKKKSLLPFRESLCLNLPLKRPLPSKLALDDLEREKKIAQATTEAVHYGLDVLRSQKVKFRRPNDYLAQMVKTDEQMAKIKKKLLHHKEVIESAQTRRNNRNIKQNRKKVRQEQMEKEQGKKQKANKEIQAVSQLRQDRLQKRAAKTYDENDNGNKNGDNNDDEFPIDMLEVEQLDDQSRFQKHKDIVSGKKSAWKPSSTTNGGKGGGTDFKRRGGRNRDDDDGGGGFRGKMGHRNGKGSGTERGNKFKPDGGIQKRGKGGKKQRLGKSRRVSQKNKS